MATQYRGYTEVPGTASPDVPYWFNQALAEVDEDVNDLEISLKADATNKANGANWYKGDAGTSGLDNFSNGSRTVSSGSQATSLGLPAALGGEVATLRWGTDNVYGMQSFRTLEEFPVTWTRRRTSSGWQTFRLPPPPGATRLTVAAHGEFNFDTLPQGPYFNDSTTIQTALGLPVQVCYFQKYTHPAGYGLAEVREWAAPNRKWLNKRTTSGWQGFTLDGGTGGGGGDIGVKTLTPDQDMANLADGMWLCPTNGIAQSLGLPGYLLGFLFQFGGRRQYTNENGVFVQSKGTTWGVWNQAGVEDGYTPLLPPTALPWLQQDTDTFTGMLLDQDHHGKGYGNNIQNWPGAGSAHVTHQYSSVSPADILDNCGSQPARRINNTRNTTITPDSNGTGDFWEYGPWDDSAPFPGENYSRWFRLTNELDFRNDTRQRPAFWQVFDNGDILEFKNQAGVVVARIGHDGSFITQSPNGANWKVSVDNAGVLSAKPLV